MQRANFDVSIKQAAISILGKGGGKIRCKSRETDLHPLAERVAVIPCEQRTTIRYQVSEMSAF